MEQIIIENGVIVGHVDSANLIDGAVPVNEFSGFVGSHIDEYDSEWRLLPLLDRVKLGRVSIPARYKLSEDGLSFKVKSQEELWIDGDEKLPENFKIEGGKVVSKTSKDLLAEGSITESEYLEMGKESQRVLRAQAYQLESDPLFWDFQRGEVTKEDWLAKVKEIRERYPYPSAAPTTTT